jgi:hypothetical protein
MELPPFSALVVNLPAGWSATLSPTRIENTGTGKVSWIGEPMTQVNPALNPVAKPPGEALESTPS